MCDWPQRRRNREALCRAARAIPTLWKLIAYPHARATRIFWEMVRGKPSILFLLGWRVVYDKARLLAGVESVNAAVGLPPVELKQSPKLWRVLMTFLRMARRKPYLLLDVPDLWLEATIAVDVREWQESGAANRALPEPRKEVIWYWAAQEGKEWKREK